MSKKQRDNVPEQALEHFLAGKSTHTRILFDHFVQQFLKVGPITVHPAKTMIGIATPRKRIAYITQLGRDFVHIVFPFEKPYDDNLCFQKIAQVPGDHRQFNHHFRMYSKEDLNAEIKKFMKMAFQAGS